MKEDVGQHVEDRNERGDHPQSKKKEKTEDNENMQVVQQYHTQN